MQVDGEQEHDFEPILWPSSDQLKIKWGQMSLSLGAVYGNKLRLSTDKISSIEFEIDLFRLGRDAYWQGWVWWVKYGLISFKFLEARRGRGHGFVPPLCRDWQLCDFTKFRSGSWMGEIKNKDQLSQIEIETMFGNQISEWNETTLARTQLQS